MSTTTKIESSSSLAEVLSTVAELIRHFVSLAEAEARIIALWVAHTHAFDAARATPYLSITSAEKQCGKTQLLEVREKGHRLSVPTIPKATVVKDAFSM